MPKRQSPPKPQPPVMVELVTRVVGSHRRPVLVEIVHESEELDAFFNSRCAGCACCLEKDERPANLCLACDPNRAAEFAAEQLALKNKDKVGPKN